ncbi:GlsB/YeaQ/YmgE family stress response membrane protein [Zeimonas arvi]|uniref:GlsB/YeaQ/YmgE family stress response membrane protein n=1 Tax=Zeimonas arvi TaxID=2498847 RepID=A0A5C8NZ11_9BURK|nr:GlsB/YeaQ/YmgE family stress response membrane protein [Zeimonas arvi]TXL66245.1 GlsB/YeaQ/YmgE family stress response membrane protein [Zeimonas arvi]
MSLIWTAIIGLAIGAVAKFIMPGSQGGGIIVTMLLGIVGAFVAGFIGRAVGFYPQGSGAGFIASVLGAILVLWAYGKFIKKG